MIEWFGCLSGLSGALLLALNNKQSRYGWLLFLISHCFWITYGIIHENYAIIIQQGGFSITTIFGVYKWFFGDEK